MKKVEDNPVPSIDKIIDNYEKSRGIVKAGARQRDNGEIITLTIGQKNIRYYLEDFYRYLQLQNGVETDNGQPDYLVKVNDQTIEFEYEEMVELLSNLKKGSGNECYEDALIKVNQLWESIPITDY